MTQPPERDRPPSNTQKDPNEWKTGDEPMTGAQRSYLETLSTEAGEPVDRSLTKAEASKRIEEPQRVTGRGRERAAKAEHSDDANRAEASVDYEDEAKQVAGGQAAAEQEREAVQRAADWPPEAAGEFSKDD